MFVLEAATYRRHDVNVINIHNAERPMVLAEKLDGLGKPVWIALIVLGFWWFWPLGLAVLAYVIWSGRMACWQHGGRGRWHNAGRERMFGMGCGFGGYARRAAPSGNQAFDDYRQETLRRLEEEQREFMEYLERLRRAKDKAEFDQFMADRGRRGPSSENFV